MRLTIKHIRTNPYNGNEEEVPEGTEYGFWRVVEHTGAGWFPRPGLYTSREEAESALGRIAEMRPEGSYWLSSESMTVGVEVNEKGTITSTPPIVRKFIGQPLKNLVKWMMKQKGFTWRKMS